MTIQLTAALAATTGAGFLMIVAGVQKRVLEHRERRRICPSCGRELTSRVCNRCAC
ncbi:MAG: hypothetical protein M3O73_01410 [Actinomycetota bacterium]|nr:hypothetical protein [Actinomycetota bacterium]MDP9304304.1 hypothetical protein [Actinomycetota bacterium]